MDSDGGGGVRTGLGSGDAGVVRCLYATFNQHFGFGSRKKQPSKMVPQKKTFTPDSLFEWVEVTHQTPNHSPAPKKSVIVGKRLDEVGESSAHRHSWAPPLFPGRTVDR